MAERTDGAFGHPSKAFGQIYYKFTQDYKDEEVFDFFRCILRECILDIWPIDGNEVVLGEVVHARRLHSLVSASAETGVGAGVLNLFLTEAGAFDENDSRPLARKTFDASRYSDLISEIPTLIGPIAMRKAIGATRTELFALEADKVLIPRTQIAKVKFPWRVSDGLALLAELQEAATGQVKDDSNWESIQHAKKRTRIRVGEIIEAIRTRKIDFKIKEGVFGYYGVYISRTQVNELKYQIEIADSDLFQNTLSASAFSRVIGLRNADQLSRLAKAGHFSAIWVRNPKTGRERFRMNDTHISEFHQKFMTATTIESEFGMQRNTLLAILKEHQAERFSPDGGDYGSIWLRASVEPIFSARAAG